MWTTQMLICSSAILIRMPREELPTQSTKDPHFPASLLLLVHCDSLSFLDCMIPKGSPALRRRALQRKIQANYQLSYEVEWSIVKVLFHESARQIALLKEQLHDSAGFSLIESYGWLDQEDFGYADLEAFQLFMEDIEMPMSYDLLDALMRRFDRTGNQKVTYPAFLSMIRPSTPTIIAGIRSASRGRRLAASPRKTHATDRKLARSAFLTPTKKRILDLEYDAYLERSKSRERIAKIRASAALSRSLSRSRQLERDLRFERTLRSLSPKRYYPNATATVTQSPFLYRTRLEILKKKQSELERKQ